MEEIKKILFIISISFFCGIFSGWFYGAHIVIKLLRGEINLSTFIFTPSKNLIDTYIMLNSSNELKRLEGYYSYKETGLNDFDFLYTRYKIEESLIIKKTIIWIAEENSYSERIHFYKKLYEVSSGSLKKYLQTKIDSFELYQNNEQLNSGEKR